MNDHDYAEHVAAESTRPLHGLVMGLVEESACVLGLVGRHVFDRYGLDQRELARGLGRALYYLTAVANTFDISLAEIRLVSAREGKRPSRGPQ